MYLHGHARTRFKLGIANVECQHACALPEAELLRVVCARHARARFAVIAAHQERNERR